MGFTPDALIEKIGGDLELALELLQAYYEDAPVRLESLVRAVEGGDCEEASRLAHSLKGMSGVIRAREISELALSMEVSGRKGNMDAVRKSMSFFVPMLTQVLEDIGAFLEANSGA